MWNKIIPLHYVSISLLKTWYFNSKFQGEQNTHPLQASKCIMQLLAYLSERFEVSDPRKKSTHHCIQYAAKELCWPDWEEKLTIIVWESGWIWLKTQQLQIILKCRLDNKCGGLKQAPMTSEWRCNIWGRPWFYFEPGTSLACFIML